MSFFTQNRQIQLPFSGLVGALVILGSTLSPLSALAHDEPYGHSPCMMKAQKLITTQGHGEIKVRPDSLNINVSVESKNPTLAGARAENNKKTQALIAALKELNIPNLKLETQGINVYPIQGEYQKDKLPKVIGYQASNSLNVSVIGAPSESLGESGSRIVDTALNAGATNVGGLNFFLSDMASARAKALELAVQDARRNADAMAKAAGLTITGVQGVEGTPQFGGYPRPVPMYAMKSSAANAEMASTPVEAGETSISSDVTVRYEF